MFARSLVCTDTNVAAGCVIGQDAVRVRFHKVIEQVTLVIEAREERHPAD